MGKEWRTIEVNVSIDNHGDERRPRDLRAYEDLRLAIESLLREDRFQSISPRIL